VEELAKCDYFVMHRHTSAQAFEIATAGRLRILMMLDGNATLQDADASMSFPLGQSLLVPASAAAVTVRPDGPVLVLEAFLP
jgi:mannose-6-phosphate isomerase class I